MSVDENITLEAWKASPLAIITVDRDWRIRFINPAGLRILARDEATLVDLPLPDLAHPLDRTALER
ncbi:MAG: PAS domain-containing protein, partial [Planctomycetota bacterium]|nr:PAS domain-containing protein [Planctomycetota bacterium]